MTPGKETLFPHTVKAYDRELRRLDQAILAMGKLVLAQLGNALEAITTGNRWLARETAGNDARIDRLAQEIDKLTLELLALRQPMALDLRTVVAALRISIDLERIGDYAANIAGKTADLQQVRLESALQTIAQMGQMALGMIGDSLDAYNHLDSAKAVDVWHRDGAIDEAYTGLLAMLQDAMITQPDNIIACTHLLFVARGLERIGDHVTNIAEHVYFLVEGSPFQQSTAHQAGAQADKPLPFGPGGN
jgi:phosphate transport system protein